MTDDDIEKQWKLETIQRLLMIKDTTRRLYAAIDSKNKALIIEVLIDNMLTSIENYQKTLHKLLPEVDPEIKLMEIENIRLSILSILD